MSKTNSYFYTNNNNNDIGIKKKRESIDCGKIKLKKEKKLLMFLIFFIIKQIL